MYIYIYAHTHKYYVCLCVCVSVCLCVCAVCLCCVRTQCMVHSVTLPSNTLCFLSNVRHIHPALWYFVCVCASWGHAV